MISIAIDGPAGTGKSTVAKKLREKLDKHKFRYLDTGAIYRGVAYFMMKNISEADIDDEDMVTSICEDLNISVDYIGNEQHILINGEDVTQYIRDEKVSKITSKIASYKDVRKNLIDIQRDMAKKHNIIMDGRDIGTEILPNANVKIFLTATPEIRARRRYDELVSKNINCDYNKIYNDIVERDRQDVNRLIAPLKKASDSHEIDTTNMSIDEVVDTILSITEEKCVGLF